MTPYYAMINNCVLNQSPDLDELPGGSDVRVGGGWTRTELRVP